MRDFQELKVWKWSHALTIKIYEATRSFPPEERYRLTDQLCRSSSSVPANIAEGQARQTTKEYIRFLYLARGSIAETKSHLILARDLDYLSGEEYNKLAKNYDDLGKMLNSLINSLNHK